MSDIKMMDRIRILMGRPMKEEVAFRAKKGSPVYMSSPNEWLKQYFSGGGGVSAGINVNEDSAMEATPVLTSIKVISETVASLPLILYRRTGNDGRERARDHRVFDLLRYAPNQFTTAYAFKEAIQGCAVLYGNGYARIFRNAAGEATEMWPLYPWRMEVQKRGKNLIYKYRENDVDPAILLSPWDVLHIPGFSMDGVTGLIPIQYQKESIGITLASQLFGANFFENSATLSGYFRHPERLSDDAYARLEKGLIDKYKGVGNSNKTGILEEGMEFQEISVPPDKAQFIETRKFQRTDTAGVNRIPPHMIGDLERATFSNIEHQSIEFLIYTMLPWFTRWEQAIQLRLLAPGERDTYFAEFLIDALVRGDIKTRMEAYRIGREIGMYSANDLRRKENEDPREGGDEYYRPLNWAPDTEGVDPPEPQEPPPERTERRAEVSKRSVTMRSRISESYKPIFRDVMERIVKTECSEIERSLKKNTRALDKELFGQWMDEYYENLPTYIKSRVVPIYRSMADAIRAEIESEMDTDIPLDEKFLEDYTNSYIARHIGSSRGQIEALIKDAQTFEEVPDLVGGRLGEWRERRAAKMTGREIVQKSNAFAKMAYAAAGVMYLRWYALGAKSCPYCQEMDGRIVSIEKTFALSGETVAGADEKLQVQHMCGHPPLHAGCVCQIGAG